MNTEPTLPPMPEVDLPEGDWFEKELYVKKFATDYAKAALAAAKQAQAEPCDMKQMCLNCQPRGLNGECPDKQHSKEEADREVLLNVLRRMWVDLLDLPSKCFPKEAEMTDKLRDLLTPCPFCGAQPKNSEREGGGDERNGYNFVVVIRCQCGVSMQRHSHRNKQGWCDDSGQAKSEVIKAWNRRAMLADKEKQQAGPVQFDPAEAMNLADSYAFAQSELDSSHFVNRPYYVESRNDARAKLASYLGIKGGGNESRN